MIMYDSVWSYNMIIILYVFVCILHESLYYCLVSLHDLFAFQDVQIFEFHAEFSGP
jgi:hypothetical protein